MTSNKLRLDEALVARGLYPSRARARDAVLRGTIWVNQAPARKPSQSISEIDMLKVADQAQHYVSRAALKLIHALDHFNISVEGRRCVDLGASTGGFTQVLLERGAAQVTAIDVGHGQMELKDERIALLEGVNARYLSRDDVPQPFTVITCDVSFIPLHLALEPSMSLADAGSYLIALIKPQFEVGRDALGKGGIVKDQDLIAKTCADVQAFIARQGWTVLGLIPSPITGGDGNAEFLIAARNFRK